MIQNIINGEEKEIVILQVFTFNSNQIKYFNLEMFAFDIIVF